ncbi:MAG: undecaprenyl-phosphate glucose phosphotransferase [Methyloprofundus sp.]|nr:undecaprenyl-phosphate glucose phosphotransferase [Methyloprofundus sp.]
MANSIEKTNKRGIVRTHRPKLLALIRLFDITIIALTLLCLFDLHGIGLEHFPLWVILVALVSFEFFAELNLLYTAPRGVNLFTETQKTLGSWLGVVVVFLLITQFQSNITEGYEGIFKVWLLLVPIELITWHLITRSLINYLRSVGKNTRQVAIIGATEIGYELEEIIKKETWLGFSFAGYFDDRKIKEQKRHFHSVQQLAGNTDALIQMVNDNKIDIVYIALPLNAERRIKKILLALSDTTAAVYYVPDLFGFDLLRSKMENLSGLPVISIHDTPFYGIDGFSKRVFDIVISSFILLLISIPLLLIAIGVKITSAGPVLFRQKRYGFNGKEIVVWKFRSMTVCEDGDNIQQATKNDMRITPFGNFLRKTSLDELPQFFNVLQGKMSIIGPRPHAVAHNEIYRGQINGYMLRHKVKPGITGLAQINGYRGETDTLDKMEGRIHYDLEYIRNWSLTLDCRIFFLTIFKGFISKQAY